MAKRQRRDSEQERRIENEKMGQDNIGGASTKSRGKGGKPKPQTYSWFVTIPVPDLRIGDFIATKVNERTGQVHGRMEVREIEPMARGCRNLHVNGKDCYDRSATVRIVKTAKVEAVLPDGTPGTVDELLHQLGLAEAPPA